MTTRLLSLQVKLSRVKTLLCLNNRRHGSTVRLRSAVQHTPTSTTGAACRAGASQGRRSRTHRAARTHSPAGKLSLQTRAERARRCGNAREALLFSALWHLEAASVQSSDPPPEPTAAQIATARTQNVHDTQNSPRERGNQVSHAHTERVTREVMKRNVREVTSVQHQFGVTLEVKAGLQNQNSPCVLFCISWKIRYFAGGGGAGR